MDNTTELLKGKDPLLEPKRIVSWWLRFPDLNFPSPDGYDKIKARAEAIAESGATTAMLFGTHFRWDFLPYFTLLHDYLATVAEELHKRGVELYDHHSVNLVHRYDTREEMRHVMLHSGPHLPFSPSREAAKSWEYNGKRLNDWRMIDVKTREALYFPQYAAEGFCYRNPEFVEAYRDYVGTLIRDTGIDGLSADDPVHFMHYNSCACPYCRAELKRRTGEELPPIDDRSFWGNWENPTWRAWIDLRFDAAEDFFRAVAPILPEGFRLTTCGHNSAAPGANGNAADARTFLRGGANYTNLEMSGNTPPYKKDPITTNRSIAMNIINASHHRAAARENGGRCFSTGFGFTEETANIVWAVNKMMGADCWFSTLKDRLGLPARILDTLPDEWDVVGRAFRFEKEHPALFSGEAVGECAVYFSYETRKHTFFGNLDKGYYKDFSSALETLYLGGVNPHTVFSFPRSPEEYPLVLLPSAARMTDGELFALRAYLEKGGKVLVSGPSAIPTCESAWTLPSAPTIDDPKDFFSYIVGGVKHVSADWTKNETVPAPEGVAFGYREIESGLYYQSARISEEESRRMLVPFVRGFLRPYPVEVTESEGYLVSTFESEGAVTVHLLAKDFDTDIDHHLDEMRFHRSRVNYITRVEPIGVSRRVTVRAPHAPTVYLPFTEKAATVRETSCGYEVTLPEKTAYAILAF